MLYKKIIIKIWYYDQLWLYESVNEKSEKIINIIETMKKISFILLATIIYLKNQEC